MLIMHLVASFNFLLIFFKTSIYSFISITRIFSNNFATLFNFSINSMVFYFTKSKFLPFKKLILTLRNIFDQIFDYDLGYFLKMLKLILIKKTKKNFFCLKIIYIFKKKICLNYQRISAFL